VLALSSTTACFSYIPTQVDAVPPGENVRVYVNRSVVESIGEITTLTEPIVRGRVMRRDGAELFVRVPVAVRQEGFHSAELGQDVRIPVGDVIAIEQRRLNPIGTGALVAGTAAGAAVILFVIMEAFGENESVEDCPECVELMTPILSIPIR
jgi:hypothetical protein